MKRSYYPIQSGQIGVIIILIVTVVLSIGLSLATRTTQQSEISIQQEDSSRVFNAAETGIEEALSNILESELSTIPAPTGTQSITLPDSDASINYRIIEETSLETYLTQGTAAEVRLSGVFGELDIEWSQQACVSNPASLLVSVYYDDAGVTNRARFFALDPQGCSRSTNFFVVADPVADSNYNFSYHLAIGVDDLFVRITPVYANTDIKVTGAAISAAQYTVLSQAQNELIGKATKAIEVKRTLSTAPAFMEYALSSNNTVVKN